MICIVSDTFDPYFNIAAEEYLFTDFSEDIFFLYRNRPSVIVGKHQNALAEINYPYIKQNYLPVIRRISGGGTVYHDLGNINFTYIKNEQKKLLVDFRKFTQPIIDFLAGCGLSAEFGGRNSLYIDGKKISGNAEHTFKNRVMHHGTLLFSTDLTALRESLNSNEDRFIDKAVRSVRSSVINLNELIDDISDPSDFLSALKNFIIANNHEISEYSISNENRAKIDSLIHSKYSQWYWNFGRSPAYRYENTIQIRDSKLKVKLEVKKGIIKKAAVTNTDTPEILSQAIGRLSDIPHREDHVKKGLSAVLSGFLNYSEINQLAVHLF